MNARLKTIPLNDPERREFEKNWNSSQVVTALGARIELSADDTIRAVIEPLKPFHLGGLRSEAVNGLVLSGLFDLVIGMVGVLQRPEKRSGTAQLSMFFFRPVLGSKVIAESNIVKGGGNLVFARARILDENGKECARCDGIVGFSSRNETPDRLV